MTPEERTVDRVVAAFGLSLALLLSTAVTPVPTVAEEPYQPVRQTRQVGGEPEVLEWPKPRERLFGDPGEVTVALTGDLLWHMSLLKSVRLDAKKMGSKRAEEYGPLMAAVKPILNDVDMAVCHAEVPVVPKGVEVTGYPIFGAPMSTMRVIEDMGFDACTMASNHSLDRGFAMLKHTIDTFEKAGVVTVGTARSAKDAERVSIFTTESGVRIGLVAGSYGSNVGWDTKRPWAVSKLHAPTMIARAKAAREAGADIVIANAHAGIEYQHAPDSQQRELAQKLTASGVIDLVYMHHAHVVQPWEKLNGVWVVYGTSNLVGQMMTSTPHANEGIIARFAFDRDDSGGWKVTKADYVPLFVSHATPTRPARIYHVKKALAEGKGDTERLRVALKRTRKVVHQMGAKGITES